MLKLKAIGLMSGTSLDGLDIAACEFRLENNKWSFKIISSHTYPYSPDWSEKLSSLLLSDALAFSFANVEYGHYLGKMTRHFIGETGFKPDIIASHGHTIFHRPDKGLTVQIGAGSAIAAETGLPVICDFRSVDVALGGQGAPLVPMGDRLLFSDFDACLNLGGFANISHEFATKRIAFDICPVNIIFNRLAEQLGMKYDKDGIIARSGNIEFHLLEKLNNLPYYYLSGPKSLGREWLEKEFIPLTDEYVITVADLMRTVGEHTAIQVNRSLPPEKISRVLVTGGGANNVFLMERIRSSNANKWIVPAPELINYKEALIFAFLGILRWLGESNVLSSATGSRTDHAGGAIYHPL
jgi:anhydro-N-acetylmuramic acid kinase